MMTKKQVKDAIQAGGGSPEVAAQVAEAVAPLPLESVTVVPEVVENEHEKPRLSLAPADVAPKRSHKSLPERAEKVANGDPLAQVLAMALDGRSNVPSPEVLERLVTLAEHIADRQAKLAFVQAFAQLQAKLLPVTPTSTSTFGPYATLGDILTSVRKPLADEGFSLAFSLDERFLPGREDTTLSLQTTLTHIGGHNEVSEVSIVVEQGPVSQRTGQPVRSIAQARAAAVTAARRLAVLSMLNLTTGDPEQDNQPEAAEPAAPEGVDDAVKALDAVRSRPQLLETWGKLPFALRTYLQRTKPELLAMLKQKYPEPEATPPVPTS